MPGIQAVVLSGVTHMYGGHPALRRLTLELRPGGITFIQGPNGAGKSTLLSILATVLHPTLGTVDYQPFGRSHALVRPHLGWVGHESHAYRDLTARENIELKAELHGIAAHVAWRRVAGRVGIEAFADQRVGTLSAGQKQRVALARALVHSPSLLLLDEPLSGLDKATRDAFKSLLDEEAARGTLLAVVTHDPGWAESTPGRVLTIERGIVTRDEIVSTIATSEPP